MDTESVACSEVIAEIASALQMRQPANLRAATYQHLSTCSRCRAGLLLVVRGFDPEPDRSRTSRACAPCQVDLAAFIDLEAEDPALAATTYPHVWWHLWTCPTCSQTYEFTHILLDAQRTGALPPLRLPSRIAQRPVPVVRRVLLTRQALTLALPQRSAVATVLRGSDDSYVLFDESGDEPEQRQFTVVVQERADGFWQMVVTVTPPPTGLLALTAGTLRLVAPFGPYGTATIDGIPPDLLTGPNAPDLEINIVPVEEH